jgi:hypothetical protein
VTTDSRQIVAGFGSIVGLCVGFALFEVCPESAFKISGNRKKIIKGFCKKGEYGYWLCNVLYIIFNYFLI